MARNKFNILFIKAVCPVIIASVGIGCSSKSTKVLDERLTVSVSIEPQKWILERIVGDKMRIVSILPGEANPESFDPPMSVMRDASVSRLYLQMGHLPWEETIVSRVKNGNNELRVVDTSAGVELITGTHVHHHDNDSCSNSSFDIDPHTWSSVRNAKIIAKNMFEAVCETDSLNVDFYTRNFTELCSSLDSLDNAFSERLSNHVGESVLVWHPSLSYFARDYGLNQISVGAENKELSLPSLEAKIDEVKRSGAKIFFVQPQMDGGKSDDLVNYTGVDKVVIHPLNYEWMDEMELLVDALTNRDGSK